MTFNSRVVLTVNPHTFHQLKLNLMLDLTRETPQNFDKYYEHQVLYYEHFFIMNISLLLRIFCSIL